jgi:hypothetical protein
MRSPHQNPEFFWQVRNLLKGELLFWPRDKVTTEEVKCGLLKYF